MTPFSFGIEADISLSNERDPVISGKAAGGGALVFETMNELECTIQGIGAVTTVYDTVVAPPEPMDCAIDTITDESQKQDIVHEKSTLSKGAITPLPFSVMAAPIKP